jgi:predicted PurR-regulated permease PerM
VPVPSRSASPAAGELWDRGLPYRRRVATPVPAPHHDPVPHQDPAPPQDSVLRRLGTASWLWLGIIGLAAVVVLGLAVVAGLVVPLVVAVLAAALLVPLVDGLERRSVPRPAGAVLVLLGFIAVLVGVVALAVDAVVSQWSPTSADLEEGLAEVTTWLEDRGVESGSPQELLDRALDLVAAVVAGPTNLVAGALASTSAFLVGAFIALFLFYLLLADWHVIVTWVSQRLWLPADVGAGVTDDVIDSLRRYYVALTISSALVSLIITLTAWLLGLPLALAIGVVTFVTSYVPYLGAIVSGAFAVLIALAAAGPTEAVIMLLVVLAVQNIVQTIVQARLSGVALQLHPIVTFSATIAGAAVAGVIGALLAVPLASALRRVVARLRAHRAAGSVPEQAVAPVPPEPGQAAPPAAPATP